MNPRTNLFEAANTKGYTQLKINLKSNKKVYLIDLQLPRHFYTSKRKKKENHEKLT